MSKTAVEVTLLLFGLVAIPAQVHDWTQSAKLTVLTAAVLSGVLIWTVGVDLWRDWFPQFLGTTIPQPNSMTLTLEVSGAIDPEFRARGEIHQSFVFSAEPGVEECADLIESASVDEARDLWSSPDSTLAYCAKARRGHAVWVHWRPNHRIIPYTLYEHRYLWQLDGFGPDGFYYYARVNRRVGTASIKFTTPKEISHAVTPLLPIWRRTFSGWFYWRLLTTRRSRVEPGVVETSDGNRTVRVAVENPPYGRVVMLFVVFRGGLNNIESEVRKEHPLRYWMSRHILRRSPHQSALRAAGGST